MNNEITELEYSLAHQALELEASETRFRSIITHSPDGIVMVDQLGCIRFVNPAAEALFDRPAQDLVGSVFGFPLAMPAQGASELDILRRNGDVAWAEMRVTTTEWEGQPVYLAFLRDITERKRAAGLLRASEELFRQLAENICEVFWIRELQSRRIVYISPTYESVWGRTCASLYAHPESFLESIHPDDRARVQAAVSRQAHGEFFDQEYRIVRPEGDVRWVWARTYPITDEYGRIYRLAGIAQDITERKQTEQSMRVKDNAIQSSINAIALAGLDGKLTYVNAAFLRLWGYADPSQVLGQPAVEFWHAPDQARAVVQALQAHGSWIGELTAKRSDGSTFDAQLSASVVADDLGQPICMMASFVDITDRKRAEDELRQRNRDLDFLYRAGQDLTSTLDPPVVLERLLHAITDTVGATGSSVWMLPELAEPEAEAPHELVCRASTRPGPKRSPVGLSLSKGHGIVGWVAQTGISARAPSAQADPRFNPRIDEQTGFQTQSVLAVPLRVRNQVIGVLEAVNKLDGQFSQDDLNMLEMLAVVAAIAVSNARLMETLRQRTDELQVRNQELDAFAHTVAHDLKTPLGLVIGHAEYALDDPEAPVSELRKSFETVIRNALRMNVIIDELLLLSQVRSAEVKAAPIQMASVLGNVLDRLALVIRDAHADIRAPDAPAWPPVWGYAPWIEEVWANYLSNAIRYGGTPPRVEIGATPLDDGRVRFWVRDNGPGISPEDQARLFKPFTQLNQVRTKGHGLGLSIVRRIVEKLGGEVGVESAPGQGSLFSFTLPGAPNDAPVGAAVTN